jgi:LuxR family transcriptional activator of conjugal transfer of Ti plasmids
MRRVENAFQEFIDGVSTASDKAAFRTVAERATQRLGFRSFAYLGLSEHGHTLISTYPKQWTTRYLSQRYDLIDPVLIRARRARDPFRWSGPQMAKGRGNQVKRFFGEAAQFGIERGVTIPIPAGFDRLALLTFAAGNQGPDLNEKVEKARDLLQLMGMYFHAHVEATLKLPVGLDTSSLLSQREAECLAWTSRGRTMDQIGQILGVKTRTVVFHLDSARAKLDAENVAHAVALALRRGLIP